MRALYPISFVFRTVLKNELMFSSFDIVQVNKFTYDLHVAKLTTSHTKKK